MTPRLLGREAEMRRLADLVGGVADGSGRVVLISGEAGIGKSRLAAESLVLARESGFLTLRGSAHPLHAGLAYAPLVEALGPYLTGLDPARLLELVTGLDDLSHLFPALQLPTPASLGDPALERTRLFEAVTQLLGALARRGPVALFVDDLHWADPATVELIHYLARSVNGHRILLLVTLRGSELTATGPLSAFGESMRRLDAAVELRLEPLDDPTVTQLVSDILGAEPPALLVEAVTKRVAGVPLFATALVGQLIESGGLARTHGRWTVRADALELLPTIVRDTVLARLTRLDATDRRLLELIAVAGEVASERLLRAVWPHDADAFDESLRRLVTDRLVVEHENAGGVRCEVVHPLYAEVAYAELTETYRRRTHAAVATALELRRPGAVVALAPHYLCAAELLDPVRTKEVLAGAGRRALDLHAAPEAARYLRAALERAEALDDRSDLPGLWQALGEAYQRCGELDRASQAWRDGIIAAQEQADAPTEGGLHHRLALLEWDRGNTALAEEVLSLGRDADPAAGRWALDQLCIRVMLMSRQRGDAQRKAEAQLTAFAKRSPDSPMAELAIHIVDAYTAFQEYDVLGARKHAEDMLPQALEADAAWAAGSALRLIALASAAVGDLTASRDHAEECVRVAHETGVPALECSARVTLAAVHYLVGDWERAREQTEQALALARRSGAGRPLAGTLSWRGILLAGRGDLSEARACLVEAKEAYGGGLAGDGIIAAGLAATEAAIGRGSRADLPMDWGPEEIPINTAVPPPVHHMVLAAGRLESGDIAGASRLTRRIRAIGRGGAGLPCAIADRLEGQIARTRGDTESACRLLTAAAARLDALGVPVEAAVARLGWAETVAETEPERAAAAASACLAEFERVGARPMVDRTRRLLRALGVRTTARPGSGALSQRESQVVRLVAEGLSNGEIAARLFLSVRTVETHLHHVYARLGLDSRVALARWVSERDARTPVT